MFFTSKIYVKHRIQRTFIFLSNDSLFDFLTCVSYIVTCNQWHIFLSCEYMKLPNKVLYSQNY